MGIYSSKLHRQGYLRMNVHIIKLVHLPILVLAKCTVKEELCIALFAFLQSY